MAVASFVDDDLAPPPSLMTMAGATTRRPGGAQWCRGLDGGGGERGQRGEQAAVKAEEVPAVSRWAVVVAAASEAWLPASTCGLRRSERKTATPAGKWRERAADNGEDTRRRGGRRGTPPGAPGAR
uniref:DUF834 domain-containing protein n=1 Tax=Oryza glumipatula TaxID=40148 RepID=A0A0D9ZC26_9ORYZ